MSKKKKHQEEAYEAQLEKWITAANAKLPAAYACIARGAESPQEAAMLAVLVAKRFCEMTIDPTMELQKLCKVADELVFVPSLKADN